MSFQSSIKYMYVEFAHKNWLNEAILMSTYNIHFHDLIRTIHQDIPKYMLSEEFPRNKTKSFSIKYIFVVYLFESPR